MGGEHYLGPGNQPVWAHEGMWKYVACGGGGGERGSGNGQFGGQEKKLSLFVLC